MNSVLKMVEDGLVRDEEEDGLVKDEEEDGLVREEEEVGLVRDEAEDGLVRDEEENGWMKDEEEHDYVVLYLYQGKLYPKSDQDKFGIKGTHKTDHTGPRR